MSDTKKKQLDYKTRRLTVKKLVKKYTENISKRDLVNKDYVEHITQTSTTIKTQFKILDSVPDEALRNKLAYEVLKQLNYSTLTVKDIDMKSKTLLEIESFKEEFNKYIFQYTDTSERDSEDETDDTSTPSGDPKKTRHSSDDAAPVPSSRFDHPYSSVGQSVPSSTFSSMDGRSLSGMQNFGRRTGLTSKP